MDSREKGINSVTMTIINPRKEYWPSLGSNQGRPVLKRGNLSTELWDSWQYSDLLGNEDSLKYILVRSTWSQFVAFNRCD